MSDLTDAEWNALLASLPESPETASGWELSRVRRTAARLMDDRTATLTARAETAEATVQRVEAAVQPILSWIENDFSECEPGPGCTGCELRGDANRVRAALAAPAQTECTGASDCSAILHEHGCYADGDGSSCTDPDDHDPAPAQAEGDDRG